MKRIYLAGALARASFIETIASSLRPLFDVVSGWHSRSKSPRDPGDEAEREAICSENLSELVRADVAVVMVDDGEPRATYGELGYALALCKPCVVVHDSGTGRCILDAHHLVVRLDLRTESLEDLPRAIEIAASLVHDRDTLPDLGAEADRMVGLARGVVG